jgi:hypothetical protein
MIPKPLRFVYRGGDWAIYAGVSQFLVAEGAGWSMPIGRALYRQLKDGQKDQMARTRPKPQCC